MADTHRVLFFFLISIIGETLMEVNAEIIRYYTNSRVELNRLSTHSLYEKVRAQQIIQPYLTETPLRILDVGGAVGVYSLWLSKMGHEVHLIDPVPLHIDEARKRSLQSDKPLSSINLGEARHLEFEDDYFDIVLFFGPLYHLINKEDRISALLESKRVTRKGGKVFCAVISRFAFLFDVFFNNILEVNDKSIDSIERHIISGQIRNPNEEQGSFTTAYAHQPNELKDEITAAGLNLERLVAVDGFGWLLPDFEQKWHNNEYKQSLLRISQSLEGNESILGISAHIMGVAIKQ
jgi:ubiquinone/menaquinone biosynthesis C-methylase UbiE